MGWTEEVECEGSMGDEAVPEMQGEVRVVATKDGDEVILVSLDCAFCGVDAMKVWGNELEPYAGSREKVLRPPGHSLLSIWYWGVRPRSERKA